MCTYKKVAITNRKIFFGTFFKGQVSLNKEALEVYSSYLTTLADQVDMIILREKDLSEVAYSHLAEQILAGCKDKRGEVILHTYVEVASSLGYKKIHVPLSVFKEKQKSLQDFEKVGVSVHSIEEALFTQAQGASYITYSPIFATDCKRGVTPKGLAALKEVCEYIQIPVYALGGINENNEGLTIKMGAAGACRMTDYMKL